MNMLRWTAYKKTLKRKNGGRKKFKTGGMMKKERKKMGR
jgi:hypothetical protein